MSLSCSVIMTVILGSRCRERITDPLKEITYAPDAFDALGDLGRYIPVEAERMEIQVTYRREAIGRLENIRKSVKSLIAWQKEGMLRSSMAVAEAALQNRGLIG